MLSAAEIEQLPEEVQAHIVALGSRISEQELEIEDLQEQLGLARFRKFARRTGDSVSTARWTRNRRFPHDGRLSYAEEAVAKAFIR